MLSLNLSCKKKGILRKYIHFNIAVFLLLTVFAAIYFIAGENIIEGIYNQTSLPFLNKIILGQDSRSLAFYIERGRDFVQILSLSILSLSLLLPLIMNYDKIVSVV